MQAFLLKLKFHRISPSDLKLAKTTNILVPNVILVYHSILSCDQVGDGGGDALLMASLTMSGFERQLYHFDEWPRQESRCLSFAAIR